MLRARADQLINKLINNELSATEFAELFKGLEKDETLASYSVVLENYFNQLIQQEAVNSSGDESVIKRQEVGERLTFNKPTAKSYSFYYRLVTAITSIIIGIGLAAYWLVPQVVNKANLNLPNSRVTAVDRYAREESVPTGKRKKVKLSDGSVVQLNADSKINFPISFSGSERTIKLEGEAYFDIQKDTQHPFAIEVDDLKIKVLGTSFNVKAYAEEDAIIVTVRSGRVSVGLASEPSEPIVLTRDQQLVFDKRTEQCQIHTVESGREVSWVDGFLQFDHTPLLSVEHALERWYGVTITVEDTVLYQAHFTGRHFNESLPSVLESICYVIDATYTKKDNRIIIKKIVIPVTTVTKSL